jgi:glycosyltransferase involved in cell wall biosynthesis
MNTYKGNQKWLAAAIDSYMLQKKVKVQLIISTVCGDPSIRIARDKGAEVFESDKPGIFYQLNNALPKVTGDWFCYAAGDDIALPTKLVDEIEMCISKKKKVCYSRFDHVDQSLKLKYSPKFPNYSLRQHLKGNFVNDCAMMHRSILEKYKPFDSEICGNHAFWDFWLRVAKSEGSVFVYNSKPEWLYRQHSQAKHIKRKKDAKEQQINLEYKHKMFKKHIHLFKKYNLKIQ